MIMNTLLITMTQEIVLMFFFMGMGNFVGNILHLFCDDSNSLFVIASSYVVGLLCVLIMLRLVDSILHNVRVTFWIVIAVCMAGTILGKGGRNIWDILCSAHWFVYFGVLIIWIMLALIISIENNSFFSIKDDRYLEEGKISVYSSLGTLHTPRSTNIAITAVDENKISPIGINYGPSLILTIFKLLHNPFLYFANFIFTVSNNTIILLFFIGMFQEFFVCHLRVAILAAIIVCWGEEGVLFRYKLPTDGASCTYWGLSSTYPDVLAVFSGFIIWLYQLYISVQEGVTLYFLIYLAICVIAWCLLAPQFLILAAGTIACNAALSFWIDSFRMPLINYAAIGGVLAVCAGIAIYFGGGMLGRHSKIDNKIEGTGSGSGLVLGNFGMIVIDLRALWHKKETYMIITRNTGKIMQALFYPFLSVMLFMIGWIRNYVNGWCLFLGIEMCILMLGGMLIEYGFSDRRAASKEELTRFLSPALVISRIVYMGGLINYILCVGVTRISTIGIFIAVSMIVFGIPYHVLFIRKACNVNFLELIPVWFRKAEIVHGSGRYEGNSRFNSYQVQNIKKTKINSEEIYGKKVYIYGTGETAQKQLGEFKEAGIEFQGFIDSNPGRWNQQLAGYSIYSPYKVSRIQDEDTVVVIGSTLVGNIVSIYYTSQLYRIKNVVRILNNS